MTRRPDPAWIRVAALVAASSCTDPSAPLGFSFEVISDEVFMTPEQRAASGLEFFPDGAGGILRDDSGYTLYLPDGGDETDPRQGARRFTATDLDSFDSLASSSSEAVLKSGTLQPGPDDFDRNYAGGGGVVREPESGALYHFYYGEFHWDPSEWFNFYGSNGQAVSADDGMSWTKQGEILRVRRPREDHAVVGSVLSTVVRDDFLYFYYQDQDMDAPITHASIAVARAPWSDLVAGRPLEVLKYHDGSFSEPGISGRFTPVAQGRGAPQQQGPASVLYDASLDLFVMVHVVYEQDQSWTLAMRSSEDGLTWSEPTELGNGTPENRLGYPMLMGLGDDPSQLGDTFALFYVDQFGDWSKARWRRMQIRAW